MLQKNLFTLVLLLTISFGSNAQAQQEVYTSERRLYNLENLELKLYQMPYDRSHIREVFIPEIESNRSTIAPNYPNFEITQQSLNTEIRDAFIDWIEDYPDEYNQYFSYLSVFIRTH